MNEFINRSDKGFPFEINNQFIQGAPKKTTKKILLEPKKPNQN